MKSFQIKPKWMRCGGYPLVNIQKTMEHGNFSWVKHGKTTISTGPCSIAMLNYQRIENCKSKAVKSSSHSPHCWTWYGLLDCGNYSKSMGESCLTIIFPYHHGCKMGIFPWQTPKIPEITWSLGGTVTWDLSDVAEFILPWTCMGHRKHHRGDGHWIARPVGAMRGAIGWRCFAIAKSLPWFSNFCSKHPASRENTPPASLAHDIPWYPIIPVLWFSTYTYIATSAGPATHSWSERPGTWAGPPQESCLKGSLPEKETHAWLWTIVPWIFHSTHWHGKFSTFKWAGLKTLFASNQGVDTDMKIMCLVIEKEVETVLGETTV